MHGYVLSEGDQLRLCQMMTAMRATAQMAAGNREPHAPPEISSEELATMLESWADWGKTLIDRAEFVRELK